MWIVRNIKKLNKEFNLPIFYKRFRIEKKLKKCVLDISALGIFNVKINGFEIDDYFMPGWTNYNKYVHLCSYDVTKYLKADNLIEITLADGWYSGRLGYTKKANVYGTENALYADIKLEFASGEKEVISTDSTWKFGKSNITSASLLDGESVDFRQEKKPYENLPNATACEVKIPFKRYGYEPIKRIGVLKPTVIKREKDTLILDFKQNFAGYVSFVAKGDRGDTVTLRHAEVLNEDGSCYYDNLRTVKATDRVVLSGGKDKFDPRFTFHGFRYVEIKTVGDVKFSNIKGIVLSQDLEYHGKFTCSNKIVNAVQSNVLWGQKSNFLSIPTDCPQRDERLGWLGDSQVFCNSSMFNSDCNRFWANYLRLIQTDMLPDGKVPSFVPFFIPVSPSTAGVPGWADAICIIPYYHYLHYRDISVIRENLPFAERHLEYYLSKCENYLSQVVNPFGDWLSVVRANDTCVISQCFLGLSALLISKMCAILGETQKSSDYLEIYQKAKTAFRENYLDEKGEILGNSQTVYALSLSVGYVSASEIKTAFLKSVEDAGGKLTTGFIGVKYLLPALCEIGETDLAYKIVKQTEYPSWGYTVENGATTIWERWNGYTKEKGFETPSMNSFNHYSLGSCSEWFYSHVLGIKLSENGKITLSPSFSKELEFAKGEYKSLNGKISVNWKVKGDCYHLTVNADKGVKYDCDFLGATVLSNKKIGNKTTAIIK